MKDAFKKQPLEVFPISVDFSRVLESLEFVDENNSSVIVTDADGNDVSTEILEGSLSESGGVIIQKIKGGETGKSYKITFLAVTTLNNTFEKDIRMDVLDT